ncbi:MULTISPECIES: sensor histidine kinase [Rhodococcus]|uniref:Sensor-like histidine kinase SenX3 n=1 Tax=Rhodococcus rhodochrous TaxID=1829 RepID=A0AAW4XIC2_RHORH|nr:MULTISPECIES: ATP-binding protein [Rhodococcus]MCD2112337.1 ATP-binding protein [Rhodococcus rhodochrous]QHG82512.1 sensor histidine kinase [Rhodococcus rhodochrous]QOH57809.1 two-component sensor histidine kinase [Rhodococcus rhodochrous]WAL45433.1 ATP-binding protein [Rhodococcus pyridinivorans]
MSVTQAVLLAVVAAVLGGIVTVAVGRLVQRRAHGSDETDLTMFDVLDRVVHGASTGIAVVDKFHDVVLSNPRAEELGLVRNRQIDDRAWVAACQVLETRKSIELDLGAKALLGREPVAVRCTVRPLLDQDPRFVVLYAFDDSEHVRMEATRRDFVANISHELKTPVGAMALLAEALLESVDDPETVRHFGERVQREATRLGNMVTELIALSKLQGAEKLPDLEVVDVDAVVDEALDRTRLTAENASITISTDRPSGLEILGDRTLLVSALTNLIENAIAYSPAGSPVTISRSLRDGKVAMAVTDRGIGIAKEDQERVFERFFRVDKARSRATGGTGLGLAIVKHVAANHHGEITLWSKPGTGSTFTLLVPAHVEDAEDDENHTADRTEKVVGS